MIFYLHVEMRAHSLSLMKVPGADSYSTLTSQVECAAQSRSELSEPTYSMNSLSRWHLRYAWHVLSDDAVGGPASNSLPNTQLVSVVHAASVVGVAGVEVYWEEVHWVMGWHSRGRVSVGGACSYSYDMHCCSHTGAHSLYPSLGWVVGRLPCPHRTWIWGGKCGWMWVSRLGLRIASQSTVCKVDTRHSRLHRRHTRHSSLVSGLDLSYSTTPANLRSGSGNNCVALTRRLEHALVCIRVDVVFVMSIAGM